MEKGLSLVWGLEMEFGDLWVRSGNCMLSVRCYGVYYTMNVLLF